MFRWIGCAEMMYNGKRTCKRTDCLYYPPKIDYNGCDYMYLTNNPRGCRCGEECTKYKYATEIQKQQYRTKVFEKREEDRLRKYRMGWEEDPIKCNQKYF